MLIFIFKVHICFSITPVEAKDLIKEYNLRETLWENQPALYQTLRQSVLELLPGKDVNRLKLYLTFFRPPEPEVYFFKALPSVLKVNSGKVIVRQ